MAFNVRSMMDLRVDLLSSPEDLQEMTALAWRFGLRLQFEADPEQRGGWVARISDAEWSFPHNDLQALVLLRAICSGTSVDSVLEDIKRDLTRIGIRPETIASAIVEASKDAPLSVENH